MTCSAYHYTECGLSNIYLQNGFHFIETLRGKAVSIKDAAGLHKVIVLFLVKNKKDLKRSNCTQQPEFHFWVSFLGLKC